MIGSFRLEKGKPECLDTLYYTPKPFDHPFISGRVAVVVSVLDLPLNLYYHRPLTQSVVMSSASSESWAVSVTIESRGRLLFHGRGQTASSRRTQDGIRHHVQLREMPSMPPDGTQEMVMKGQTTKTRYKLRSRIPGSQSPSQRHGSRTFGATVRGRGHRDCGSALTAATGVTSSNTFVGRAADARVMR